MTSRFYDPRPQMGDANGRPMAGCLLYTYEAGTSTPLATYSDSALTVPNENPVEFNSEGRPPNDIFLGAASYRMVLQTAAGVTVWTADPVDGASTDLANSLLEVSGTANAIVLTSPFVANTYQAGQVLRFEASAANTSTSVSINWNGLGTRALVRADGTPLPVSAWAAGELLEVLYDGAEFRLTSPSLHRGWVLIEQQAITNQAEVDFDLPAGYTAFELEVVGLKAITDAAVLQIRCSSDGGDNFVSGATDYVYQALTHASTTPAAISVQGSSIALTGGIDNSTAAYDSGLKLAIHPGTATNRFRVIGSGQYLDNTPEWRRYDPSGCCTGASAVMNAIRLTMTSGNVTGSFTLLGLRP